MRLALAADVFPPLRSSGAVQLRDLAAEFARQGHALTVLVASPGQAERWRTEAFEGAEVVRLRSPQTKDVGLVRRTFAEWAMARTMLRHWRASPLAARRFDGVIWYSPTIFLAPLVAALKRESGCPGYLIIRDIFPQWALDMGLMRPGPAFRFFDAHADAQYRQADVIGVQTPGNLAHFERWRDRTRLEVLQNWLAPTCNEGCPIDLSASRLAGRRLFVYAGNMGIAQGTGVLLDLATRLRDRRDLGWVFVGRGSDAKALATTTAERGLDNTLFFDEIDPRHVRGLYDQCDAGLIALDPRHTTHNIPGKFLSYMDAGLPVLASVNAGNDLVAMVEAGRIGRVCTDGTSAGLDAAALALLGDLEADRAGMAERCRAVAAARFSPQVAVRQIVDALTQHGAAAGLRKA